LLTSWEGCIVLSWRSPFEGHIITKNAIRRK
jgi:hypothetical protein